MKFATALLVALGLVGSPLSCLIQSCPLAEDSHDCCPQTPSAGACPLDILAAAKIAPQQHSLTAQALVAVPAPTVQPMRIGVMGAVASVMADERNLHLRNRVLLV